MPALRWLSTICERIWELAETILEEALRLIRGDREKEYGDVSVSFERIAKMWSAYLGTDVNETDVASMMIMLKTSRTRNGYHRDSFVDIAGYAALAGVVVGGEELHADENQAILPDLAPREWESLLDIPRGTLVTMPGQLAHIQITNNGTGWHVMPGDRSCADILGWSLAGRSHWSGPFTEVLS